MKPHRRPWRPLNGRLWSWKRPKRSAPGEWAGLKSRAFHASGCAPVAGESPADARRRGTAAEAAAEVAEALRDGDLDLAARLLRELNGDMDALGIGPAS